MKKTALLLLMFMGISIALFAQSPLRYKQSTSTFQFAFDSTLHALSTANPSDTTEGGGLNEFSRWGMFVSNRLCADAPAGEDMIAPSGKALKSYMSSTGNSCSSLTSYSGNWKCVGPFNNYFDTTGGITGTKNNGCRVAFMLCLGKH